MDDALGLTGGLTCAHQVSDLDASIRWYEDVMGFSLLYRVEEFGWCEMATMVTVSLSSTSDFHTSDSVWGSSEAVTSSSTNRLGSCTSARAIAMR